MSNRGNIEQTSLEQTVENTLIENGLSYIPQYSTRTGFVIDFAVFEGCKSIALEVDGPHHDNPKQRKKDGFKSHMLKREGWTVIRLHWSELKNINNLKWLIPSILYNP